MAAWRPFAAVLALALALAGCAGGETDRTLAPDPGDYRQLVCDSGAYRDSPGGPPPECE
jgi:hypothetical protein